MLTETPPPSLPTLPRASRVTRVYTRRRDRVSATHFVHLHPGGLTRNAAYNVPTILDRVTAREVLTATEERIYKFSSRLPRQRRNILSIVDPDRRRLREFYYLFTRRSTIDKFVNNEHRSPSNISLRHPSYVSHGANVTTANHEHRFTARLWKNRRDDSQIVS